MDASLTFFQDIKDYVEFDDEDAQRLRTLLPLLDPHFEGIAEHFYERILAHPRAHDAIKGGQAQVERLKKTLVSWMQSGLAGPHDEEFYARRARIGRIHVQIGLPQQYMVTAMNVMRLDYRKAFAPAFGDCREFARACASVDRLFDLELAIMFETFQSDSEDRLRRRERLATIGQIAASIGHDLRNPLGVIESSLFIIRRKVSADERVMRHVEKIAKQVQTCERIVHDLLDMARNQAPRVAVVNLGDLVAEAREQAQLPPEVSYRADVAADLQVAVDPGLFRQALVNLLTNSARALAPTGGTVVVSGRTDEAGDLHLRVSDDGPGFDPEVLPTAFEPLVTTRAKGIGLGLALVKSVVERHRGEVRAGNHERGGAQVDIHVPNLMMEVQP